MDTVTIQPTEDYKFRWHRLADGNGVCVEVSDPFPTSDAAYADARVQNPGCVYNFVPMLAHAADQHTEQLDDAEVQLIRVVLRLVRREYGQKATVHDREELLRAARSFVDLASEAA